MFVYVTCYRAVQRKSNNNAAGRPVSSGD